MDGIFVKQRITKIYNIISLISGILLVLLFGGFICIGELNTLDDMIISCFFICFGLLVSILCGISLYVNQKAYIHVDDNKISAFCHFGLSLKCDLSDISSVSYKGTELNIQLKNGKKYILMHLENAFRIGKYIQKKVNVKPAIIHNQDELRAAIPLLIKKCRYEGLFSIICFLLLFSGIFITTALTGWKDLHEFSSYDWNVFTIMSLLGIITIIVFCILFRKYLLHTEELKNKQGTLYQAILQTTPVQPGNAIKLFIDDEIYASVRLTIYGYPNADEVYFTVEQVNQNYEIECIYTSKVYSNINELSPEIEDMTEIAIP